MVAGDVVWVTIDGEVFSFTVTHGAARARAGASDQDAFTPPMSATVVRIAVKVGDSIMDGDVLIALEAMKMELPIRAPRDGVVQAIHCKEGELVQPGHVLLELK
jgi:acetyl-CoA/propionyl-CoA carboxylase biotin carboxyl carrier protein